MIIAYATASGKMILSERNEPPHFPAYRIEPDRIGTTEYAECPTRNAGQTPV